jgi:hypothetical protein
VTKTARDIFGTSEHDEQAALIVWCQLNEGRFPELHYIYAVPNGARTSPNQARRLKEEGMKSGVPDLCLPVPRGPYHGLYIEMKKDGGRASTEQKKWLAFLKAQGYYTSLSFSFEQAKDVIEFYLGQDRTESEVSNGYDENV